MIEVIVQFLAGRGSTSSMVDAKDLRRSSDGRLQSSTATAAGSKGLQQLQSSTATAAGSKGLQQLQSSTATAAGSKGLQQLQSSTATAAGSKGQQQLQSSTATAAGNKGLQQLQSSTATAAGSKGGGLFEPSGVAEGSLRSQGSHGSQGSVSDAAVKGNITTTRTDRRKLHSKYGNPLTHSVDTTLLGRDSTQVLGSSILEEVSEEKRFMPTGIRS